MMGLRHVASVRSGSAAGRRELIAIANWVTHSEKYVEAICGVTLPGTPPGCGSRGATCR